jgi:hypothetical protein
MKDHDDAVDTPATDSDGGCAVDWSWLSGRAVDSATSDLTSFRVRFADGQTLTIRALLYKGKPFLSFEPYKAPGASK